MLYILLKSFGLRNIKCKQIYYKVILKGVVKLILEYRNIESRLELSAIFAIFASLLFVNQYE